MKAKFFTLMTSSIIFSYVTALLCFVLGRNATKTNTNPKGNTGNPLVDIFNGREMNPKYMTLDWKLQMLR